MFIGIFIPVITKQKRYKIFTFWVFCSFCSYSTAQICDDFFLPPTNINGVAIRSSSTGSVSAYTSSFTSCRNITTPTNAIWLGSTGAFTYTIDFSSPINQLTVMMSATGGPTDENFIFTTNAGTPTISTSNSCFSRIEGNQVFSGLGSPSEGGGGVFLVKSDKNFTSITISGSGGANGTLFAFCSNFKKNACCVADISPTFSSTKMKGKCGDLSFDLTSTKALNQPSNAILTWHSSSNASNSNRIDVSNVKTGNYFAAFYDQEHSCYSTKSTRVDVTLISNPLVDAGNDISVTKGEQIILVGTGARTYIWNKNVKQGIPFIADSSQTYTVVGTDENGCSASDEVFVSVEKLDRKTFDEIAVDDFDEKYFKPVNLVFVLDISNSMNSYNKLSLMKNSVANLVDLLRPQDKITLVTYASESMVILETMSGSDKESIKEKVLELQALGSTAGTAGIKLGFKEAKKSFIEDGTNLLVVITDGAISDKSNSYLNVIEKYQKSFINLSVVGVKNATKDEQNMREAAKKGNGRYVPIFTKEDTKHNLIMEIKKHAFKF